MKKSAFTFAETMTTILLIGIVSAITIPVLNINIARQKKVAMLKKVYSDFSVNIQSVLGAANCNTVSCLRKYGNVINPASHNGAFADPSFMSIENECPVCFGETDVMPLGYRTNVFSIYRLRSGAYMALVDFQGNCLVQRNGLISLHNVEREQNARGAWVVNKQFRANPPICGMVVFDVNGSKGPNLPGGDRFAYYIVDDPVDNSYLVPIGYKTSDDVDNNSKYNQDGSISSILGDGTCLATNNQIGYNCTGKIMRDGWKIKY